jgi:hypothetical protein
MITLRTLVATAALVTMTPLPVCAADLRVVASNDEEEILIDVDSIQDVESSHHEATFISTYNTVQRATSDGPPFRVAVARIFFRCLDATGSLSKLSLFADAAAVQANKPTSKFDYPVIWKPVEPDSDVAVMWKYVCTKGWEAEGGK